MARGLIFQGMQARNTGKDDGSYGMILRKLLIFKRIDAAGWIISETPVAPAGILRPRGAPRCCGLPFPIEIMACLPQVKLSEFTSFIQIRFGNRQLICKLNT
jgi:hypothetical protein